MKLPVDVYVTRDGESWVDPVPQHGTGLPVELIVRPIWPIRFALPDERDDSASLGPVYREFRRVPLRLNLEPLLRAMPEASEAERVDRALKAIIGALERARYELRQTHLGREQP